jgi:Cu2+-containing amine oxidase
MTGRISALCATCAAAVLIAGTTAAECQPSPSHATAAAALRVSAIALPVLCPNFIVQDFPISGPAQTTWHICWREVAGNNSTANPNGLVIGPVYFRKSPNASFIRVLWDMRVSDYFVPYHSGSPRYYDLSGFNFVLAGVSADDCPASVGGTLLSPRVCKEVRDRGLLWKDWAGVKRGQELVIWGAIDAGNYRYIQEYTFRDDGVIIGRMGATGQNLPGRELETHVHNAIWRIDIDLDGATNSAARVQHSENLVDPNGAAADKTSMITTATGFTWSPRAHDAIEITNPSFKNAQGHVSSYHLVPLVTGGGLTQHKEKFTQNEFWVTPYNSMQFAAKDLPSYLTASPSVANGDLVVWYKGSLHHHPRDEDGVYVQNTWMGTALVMWTGFMLMPHNLLDCAPLYKPCP